MIYFDNASSRLYSDSLIPNIIDINLNKDWNISFNDKLYSNPHSLNNTSLETTNKVNEVRNKVLKYVNASPEIYECIFTSGTTHSLKIIGEYFDWSPNNKFIYTLDNHTSVIGIREYALKNGSTIEVIDFEDNKIENINSFFDVNSRNKKKISDIIDAIDVSNNTDNNINLFVMPAESNFSGKLYDRELINEVRNKYGDTIFIYDVAKYISTNRVDMSDNLIDIIPISFYKIFGFPTGLGALIIKKSVAKYLKKTYYGGGSILINSAYNNYHEKNTNFVEKYEDGSPNYINIIYLDKFLDKSMDYVKTKNITFYFFEKIRELIHNNGQKVFQIYDINLEYNFEDFCKKHGSIITFNLLNCEGNFIGYRNVELLLNSNNIAVRTGCLCNSGSCMKNLKISPELLKHYFSLGHSCNNIIDIIDNKPTGAIRASFCDKFIEIIKLNYVL